MSDVRSQEIGRFVFFWPPIGRGSFAKVYKGYDRTTRQPVAVKRIVLKDIPQSHRHRIDSELDIMAKMQHTNVIRLIDVQRDASGNVYIVTELCEGGDLAQWLRKQHRSDVDDGASTLDEREIQHVALQLRDALMYLHSMGLVHRDLKPKNILIHYTRESVDPSSCDIHNLQIKLCDFGFAKYTQGGATQASPSDDVDGFMEEPCEPVLFQTLCGSPMYLAPEIAMNQHYTTSSDLWSIGVILFELITGHPPLHACRNLLDLIHMMHSLQGSVQVPSQYTVSKTCRDLVRALLTVRAEDRITWEDFFAHPWFEQGLIGSLIQHQPARYLPHHLKSDGDIFRMTDEIDNSQGCDDLGQQQMHHHDHATQPMVIPGTRSDYETRVLHAGTPIVDDYTDSCSSVSAPGFPSSAPRSSGTSVSKHSPSSPGWLASVTEVVGSYGTSIPHLNRFLSDSVQMLKGTLGISKGS